MNLLIVEDNPQLIGNLSDFFTSLGHIVDLAYDGLTGLRFAQDRDYDVIVLDLNLPGLDGLQVCKRLRAEGQRTPILMLTARDTVDDKLHGFDAGADDYLVKPFDLRELLVRVQALSRRIGESEGARQLQVADLVLDLDTLEVSRNGTGIPLGPIPMKLLEILMRQSPKVVTRQQLEQAVWGDNPPDSDSLRAHLHMLRSAIDRGFDQPLLHTKRGIGYQLVAHQAPR